MNRSAFAATLACTLLLALPAHAQTYRWTDSNGRTIISDAPPKGKTESLESYKNAAPDALSGLPYATRVAVQKHPVTLFTAGNCQNECKQARESLQARGIPFTEKVIQSEDDKAELKKLVGDLGVPSLKVGKQSLRGLDLPGYDRLLDMAGYPNPAGARPRGDKP